MISIRAIEVFLYRGNEVETHFALHLFKVVFRLLSQVDRKVPGIFYSKINNLYLVPGRRIILLAFSEQLKLN